jgi:PPOX class probable F420-dependent enzyme
MKAHHQPGLDGAPRPAASPLFPEEYAPMSIEISPQLQRRLQEEKVAWLTTVRADGVPQPTPIWFLWQHGTFLIYSKPDARKVRNIRQNPHVALNFNTDEEGEHVVVFRGDATVEAGAPLADHVTAYVDKYRQGITDLEMTPETMAREYSVAIRITPLSVRDD